MGIAGLVAKAAVYGERHIRQHIDYTFGRGWAKPDRVSVTITNRCNCRCKMCDLWKTKIREEDELPAERWIDIIDELHEWIGPYFLALAGGEVFVKKGIFDIIGHAAGTDISLNIISNGAVFRNRHHLDRLLETKLPSISFSVDGIDPAFHDETRGIPGLHASIEETIRTIKKERFKIRLTDDF